MAPGLLAAPRCRGFVITSLHCVRVSICVSVCVCVCMCVCECSYVLYFRICINKHTQTSRLTFFYLFSKKKLQTATSCPVHLPHTRGERLAQSSVHLTSNSTDTQPTTQYAEPTTQYAQSTTQYETSAPWVAWLASERSIGY